MTIAFEAYAQADGNAALPRLRGRAYSVAPGNAASGRLPSLRSTASGTAFYPATQNAALPRLRGFATTLAGNIGMARLPRLRAHASALSTPKPNVAVQIAALPRLQGTASGTAFYPGNQNAALPRLRSFASTSALPIGRGCMPRLKSNATGFSAPQNFATMLLSAGYMVTGSSDTFVTRILNDSFSMFDEQTAHAVLALLDLFTLSDSFAATLNVLQQLDDSLTLGDIALLLYRESLIDTFIASDVLTGTARITALLSDAFTVSDTTTSKSQVLAVLQDAMYISAVLSTGEETYTAWVMTPQTKAMRRYNNFPFNSYAMLNGQAIAASAAGIYQLEGATDAGAVIAASVRSGMIDFGTQQLKRIDRAYLGYTSNGTLCLRVSAVTATGTKSEYTYKMVQRTADAPRDGVIPIGRGTRAVYWSFELCNDADGNNFELHDITVLPMVLDRRIN